MRIIVVNAKKLKRRVLAVSIIIVIISFMCFLTLDRSEDSSDKYVLTSISKSERVIIIDPGHGGEDPGASGASGVLEKDLNLRVALLVGDELIKEGYTVVFTRTSDRLLYKDDENIKGMRKICDLKNRCAFADEYDNPIFISIHMNNYGASKYSGLQVYYSSENDESKMLADFIQESVRQTLQVDNTRKIKNGKGLYILDNCKATSVIVECGFLSNEEECKKLSEEEYQKQLSVAIVCGIIEYIDGKI